MTASTPTSQEARERKRQQILQTLLWERSDRQRERKKMMSNGTHFPGRLAALLASDSEAGVDGGKFNGEGHCDAEI